MRRAVAALTLAALAVAGSLAPASAQAVPTFTFVGQGVGPGVGLSQAGARGLAVDGATDAAILAWYFPGTTLTTGADPALDDQLAAATSPMPTGFPIEALRAQAIASRTALVREPRALAAADAVDPRWATAVRATAGLTLEWRGAPIRAVWTASTAGTTDAAVDALPGRTQEPYLVPVPDPWSLEDASSRWSITRSANDVATAFRLGDVVALDDRTERTAGGGAKVVIATSSSGQRARLSGPELRDALGLPSHFTGPGARRVAGADRFQTSAGAGQAAAPVASSIVVVSGEPGHLVDGLVAAPLAQSRGAPVLLATAGGLPQPVAEDVARRRPVSATLIGGGTSLGPEVERQLRDLGVGSIERLAGDDRYATAALVARAMGTASHVVAVASGEPEHLVDALTAGGYAATNRIRLLLVRRDEVPEATSAALATLAPSAAVVAGGSAAVSDAVAASLPSARRLSGADRFATAAALASDRIGPQGEAVIRLPDSTPMVIAAGDDRHLVDALAAGSFAVPILLTAGTGLHPAATTSLRSLRPSFVDVVGGRAAVSLQALVDADALIAYTGRAASRVPGFDEVALTVQPVDAAAVRSCALLADDPTTRAQGLSGRDDLAGYPAMAFVFDEDTVAPFWMRSTRIPLSIAWFGTAGLVGQADMAPCPDGAECPLHHAPAPYRVAVEVPQGRLGEIGAGSGSTALVGGSCPGA